MKSISSFAAENAKDELRNAPQFVEVLATSNRDLTEKKMKSLKRMTMCVLVTVVVGLRAFGGEVSSPPCPPPVPGEMSAPPCSGTQQTSDDPAQGQTQTATTTAVTETIITDTAIDLVVGSILSLL